MRVALVSFDLDGTLVDTAGEIAMAANHALAVHGVAPRATAEITALIGVGARELMRQLWVRCTLERPSLVSVPLEAVVASFEAGYAEVGGTLARPYEGCSAALAELQRAGIRLACTTNKDLRHTRHLLAATQLAGFFDLVIGGDSLPEKKPHRSVLEHVMGALGVSRDRTAHVGDSWIDVQAARSAGVRAWAVSYGYNGGQPIASAAPDQIFASLLDVARYALAS